MLGGKLTLGLVLALVLLQGAWATRAKLHEERPAKVNGGLLEAEAEESAEEEDKKDVHGWSIDDWFTGRRRISFPRLPQVKQLETRLGDLWRRLFGGKKESKSSEEAEGEEEVSVASAGSLGSALGSFGFGDASNFFRPWWKGENVCKREEVLENEGEGEEEETATLDGDEDESTPSPMERVRQAIANSLLTTSCQDNGEVYTCEMGMRKEGKSLRRRITYECCHGFTREAGKSGCPQPLSLDSLPETLAARNLSNLLTALEATALDEMLTEGNWTLFAPTDEALSSFADAPIEVVTLGNGENLPRQILESHLISGWSPRHSWSDEGLLETLNPDASVRINYYGGGLGGRRITTANCARIMGSQIRTQSGLINVVDRLLVPARRNLWEMISEDGRFSRLAELASDEEKQLLSAADQHLTLFAFSDEAMEALPESTQEKIAAKEGCFSALFAHLLVPHTICSAAIHRPAFLQTLGRHHLNVSTDEEGSLLVQGGKVSLPDRMATNGVLHVLGAVPLLPHMRDGLAVAEAAGRSAFAEAMREVGLDEELAGLDQATLFVPPDASMADFLPEDREAKVAFLRNHLVDNLVEVTARNRETLVETAAEKTLTLKVEPLSFFASRASIGCARITAANIRGCSATLHLLDRALALPAGNALEVLRAREDLSEFVTLLEISGLSDRLESEEFGGTVLAVPNEALNELLTEEKKEELVNDEAELRKFLGRHLLAESACCHSMGGFRHSRHVSLAEDVSLVSRRGRSGDVSIGGVDVLECDLAATNGMVHLLAKPIPLPKPRPSIFDFFRPASHRGARTGQRSRRRFDSLDWPF